MRLPELVAFLAVLCVIGCQSPKDCALLDLQRGGELVRFDLERTHTWQCAQLDGEHLAPGNLWRLGRAKSLDTSVDGRIAVAFRGVLRVIHQGESSDVMHADVENVVALSWANNGTVLAIASVAPDRTLSIGVMDAALNCVWRTNTPLAVPPVHLPRYCISWNSDDALIAVSTSRAMDGERLQRWRECVLVRSNGTIAGQFEGLSDVYFVGDRRIVGSGARDIQWLGVYDVGIYELDEVFRPKLTGRPLTGSHAAASNPRTGHFAVWRPLQNMWTFAPSPLDLYDRLGRYVGTYKGLHQLNNALAMITDEEARLLLDAKHANDRSPTAVGQRVDAIAQAAQAHSAGAAQAHSARSQNVAAPRFHSREP